MYQPPAIVDAALHILVALEASRQMRFAVAERETCIQELVGCCHHMSIKAVQQVGSLTPRGMINLSAMQHWSDVPPAGVLTR
jgi:hypothetical protein